MFCEDYENCVFIKAYNEEAFMEKYVTVHCCKEKQNDCARKKFFLKNNYQPPYTLTPQGIYLLSKD